MAMRPNLHFPGHARDVLEFYRAALGGTLDIRTYGGSPVAATTANDWSDKVLYGRLSTPYGDVDIMDAPPDRADAPGGNVAISLEMDDVAIAQRAFDHLAVAAARSCRTSRRSSRGRSVCVPTSTARAGW